MIGDLNGGARPAVSAWWEPALPSSPDGSATSWLIDRHERPVHGMTAHYSVKSFSCNTYGSPRKCCKQKTYGLANPFRCNTYKKRGVPSFKPKVFSLRVFPLRFDVSTFRPSALRLSPYF